MFLGPRPQLTPSQLRRLEEHEKQSFHEFSRRIGYPPDELEKYLLQMAKEEIELTIRMASMENQELEDRVREDVKDMLSANDWWTFKRFQVKTQAEALAADISRQWHSLPVNWNYLNQISDELKIRRPRPDSPESVISFVLSIPHVQIYGTEFNAFVGQETDLDDIPCVSVYEHLIIATERFLDVVLKGLIRQTSAGSVTVAEPEDLKSAGKDSKFMDACEESLSAVLCRTDIIVHDPDMLLSRTWPEMQLPFRMIAAGATDFVWNHEYGHLLMGHLQRGSCHQVEYEADAFAWKVQLSKYDWHPDASFWYLLGGISILTLFIMIEAITKDGPSESHPSGKNRLYAILGSLDQGTAMRLLTYSRGMLIVCEDTIAQRFGASLSEHEANG